MKQTKKTRHFCFVCGMPVDLRKKGSNTMSEWLLRQMPVGNPEYRYWCSEECYKKFKQERG